MPRQMGDIMNKERRKEIRRAISILEEFDLEAVIAIVEQASDEEQEYYDNMPENMQQGEKGENAEAAASQLEEAKDALEQISTLDIISMLEEAESY